jgi:chromosome segregation ATPase
VTPKQQARAVSKEIRELSDQIRELNKQRDMLRQQHRNLLNADVPHQISLTRRRLSDAIHTLKNNKVSYPNSDHGWWEKRIKAYEEKLRNLEASKAIEDMVVG